MGVILTRRRQLAYRIEATEGTLETFTPGDVSALIINPAYRPEIAMFDRPVVSETFSKFRRIPGTQQARISFGTELKGIGVKGAPPAMGPLLRGAALLEAITETVGGYNTPAVGAANRGLRKATTVKNIAASFTSAGEDITVVYLHPQKVGTIAAGKKVWVRIETDAAGDPSGTAVTNGISLMRTAQNVRSSYALQGKTAFYFNPTVTLAPGDYHVVLEADYALSDTNYLEFRVKTGIGGTGNFEKKDTVTWADDTDVDLEGYCAEGDNVKYTPISTLIPSLSLALYTGDDTGSGVKKPIKGSRGNVRFVGQNGQPMMAEFDYLGVYVDPTDSAPLSGVEYDLLTEPRPLLEAAFTTQDAFAAKIQAITLDMGNTLALRDDISTESGFFSTLITDRSPNGNFNPEETLLANHDWWTKLKEGTEGEVTFSFGDVPGNIVDFSLPKVEYRTLTEADRNRIATLGLDFFANRDTSTGDDELVITFS